MAVIALLAGGLILLVWGADRFIDASSKIALQLGVSELVIGLTLIAFGTSAPEVSVAIASVLNQNANIATGTIVGSNIANIGLVFGISMFAFVGSKGLSKTPLVCFALSVVWLFIALQDLNINVFESIGFIVILLLFLYGLYQESESSESSKKEFEAKEIFFALVSLTALIIGAQVTVENAEKLALLFGISETVIGLTIIAVGTSLPELAASLAALYKQKGQMIVGNIIGSNVFNIVTVMPIIGFGIQASIDPQIIANDIWYLIVLSALFLMIAALQTKISASMLKVGGTLLIGIYSFFVFSIFFGL
ncbi:MAG: calcium/sodium antiporter [Gammaproteobacteria bacterium]|jgi:cation:H+ antiporter